MIFKINVPISKFSSQHKDIEYDIVNECWICTSHMLDKDGYPTVRRQAKQWRLSRYIYQLEKGEIPEGYVVMHSCDNPSCINPEHLKLGTARDNVHDKIKKDRHARGERNGSAKLSPEQIIAIRNDNRSIRKIANDYNVHFSQIGRIKNGSAWKHSIKNK